jgi:uncharacterized membrane protein
MDNLLSWDRQGKISIWFYLRLFIVTFLLILGIYFRFANLAEKIFWVDEASTITRVAGYTKQEIVKDLIDRDIVEIGVLYKYQQVQEDRSFIDTLNALQGSPEHAPLYFLCARFWLNWGEDSIVNLRSLSVFFSLLVLPCLYWLCRELFDKPTIGWWAVMLMCISPFYVAYAQEARPYSLWTVTILAIAASFLRAIRINSWYAWLLYGFCLLLGLYTSLFSLFIAIFQGIYLLFVRLKIFKKYLIAVSISLVLFAPWLLVIFTNSELVHDNTFWMRDNFNLANIIGVWIGTILLIFGDLPISPEADPLKIVVVLISTIGLLIGICWLAFSWHKLGKLRWVSIVSLFCLGIVLPLIQKYLPQDAFLDRVTFIGTVVAIFILALATFSLYFLITHTTRDRWLFIISLILAVPLPLLLADIINQGQSAATPRYLIPLQLGIQIAAAYTIDTKLHFKSAIGVNFWRIVIIFFIILGIFSCTRNLHLSPLYLKGRNIHNIPIAQIIDRVESPLMLVESQEIMDAISLSHYLSPKVKLKIIDSEINLNNYLDRFSSIFVLKPSASLKHRLELNTQLQFDRVYQPHLFSPDEVILELWEIKD